MITHHFVCDSCKIEITDNTTKIIHKCPKCGQDMRWNTNVNCGKRGDYEHISESLAVSPSQIKEHHQQFPDVDVLSDGRIRFTSYKQHDKYLEKTGFRKVPQKLKGLGRKRIKP